MAADEEARELAAAAGGDLSRLEELVTRRLAGEPLAWVTGWVDFAGTRLRVDEGVYVPRYETRILVTAALEVLPADGMAVDLCTGSGAVAAALRRSRPGARVVASDVDPVACRCATSNEVEVYEGDLDAPLPASCLASADVVTAVAPYVPTDRIEYMPRDFRDYEPVAALDGGPDGLRVVGRVVAAGARLLRPDGWLVLELGAGQDRLLAPILSEWGYGEAEPFFDEDGDLRAIRARLG
ncbi:MAG TPA: HemK/PrmC family methyltransferase [Acidimicrobiales bacterium]|nr:HemK/PrmC family methyltransferase [Acidimicrobiales bacterium]